MDINTFKRIIKDYYKENGRVFPWRNTTNPYHIMASEIMLQQTQTFRVEPKYNAFIQEFPSFEALAQAPFAHVLLFWKGLGYNRRALALHNNAKRIVQEFKGVMPNDPAILETFDAIGYATACSITAFAFNRPTVFIETNIRSVFIHFFFKDQEKVHDKEIFPLVQESVDTENPREWYYALMDYGVLLKKQNKKINERSTHYTRQSPFEGSDRQVRGKILDCLLRCGPCTLDELYVELGIDYGRLQIIIDTLTKDKLIREQRNKILLVS